MWRWRKGGGVSSDFVEPLHALAFQTRKMCPIVLSLHFSYSRPSGESVFPSWIRLKKVASEDRASAANNMAFKHIHA